MEYSQKRCDNYVVRFKTEISPKLISAGIPPETCDKIKKQWISLASPDLNPFESIIDYGTLQKGYEVFKGALLDGSKSIVRDSVKNWDRLYEARESMRGNEHLYYEQAKEHLLPIKDKTHTAPSHTNENVKEKTRTLITIDKAREIGSKAVTFRDGLYMKNTDEYLKSHGVPLSRNSGERSVREAAAKAGEQLKREESKAAERTNKSINKAISSLER